ncbi:MULTISPECIES: TetR/AcrR family transcriptional regulator [unclassified Streptomyces]|uniref:TetR/AcrR family transcriptional regulator n=1 Tax=unclassified Streptomyces TaxID=2593676 RepID=UPI0016612D6F|nr:MULTISPECIES: TetR/AcrR family transcriptional regulator [unclassified Streptomyces]
MADGTRARRLPRAVRERQMLDAAVRSFARHGYQATSMDEVAELAGVSKPLVYLYLHSKEDLFTTVIRREGQALLAVVAEAVSDRSAPPDERLWAGLLAFFSYAAGHPDAWTVLSRQARTQGEPFAGEVTRLRAGVTDFIAGLIDDAARETRGPREAREAREARGPRGAGKAGEAREPRGPRPAADLPDLDVTALAQALVGAAESLANWANETEGVTARDTATTLMNFAWSGLGNLMRSEGWAPAPGGSVSGGSASGRAVSGGSGAGRPEPFAS